MVLDDREDPSQFEENPPESANEMPKIRKPSKHVNVQSVEVKEGGRQVMNSARDTIIAKVLGVDFDEIRQKRMGTVQLNNGRVTKLDQSVLKQRFPEKVIEYYEDLLN